MPENPVFTMIIQHLKDFLQSLDFVRVPYFLIVLLLGGGLQIFFKYKIVPVLKKIFQKTETKLDDLLFQSITRPVSFLIVATSFCMAVLILDIDGMVNTFVSSVLLEGLAILAVVWVFWNFTSSLPQAVPFHARGFAEAVRTLLRPVVLIVALVILLHNLGYNVRSLLATLGIGGIALAFAAQDTIKNLFGTFMIIADKPFKVGDMVDTEGIKGQIARVGLRSTKIQSLEGHVVSIPNGILANQTIRNWTEAPHRRIQKTLQFTYETTSEQIKAVGEALLKNLEAREGVFKGPNIYFKELGDSSLNLSLSYRVKGGNWSKSTAIQTSVNHDILKIAEEHKAEFAYPTLSLYHESGIAKNGKGEGEEKENLRVYHEDDIAKNSP